MRIRNVFFGLMFFISFTPITWAFQPQPGLEVHLPDQVIQLADGKSRQLVTTTSNDMLIQICGLESGRAYQFQATDHLLGNTWEVLPQGDYPCTQQGKELSMTAVSNCVLVRLQTASLLETDNGLIYLSVIHRTGNKLVNPLAEETVVNPPPVQVTQATNYDSLVLNNFLAGDCFEVFNISTSGDSISIGTFNSGSSTIGIESGILLTTGDVANAVGPNLIGSSGTSTTGPGTDSDLDSLASGQLYDITILEFDFIPTVEMIQFNYVFASEEYCEFVEDDFNDIFGFFISSAGNPAQNIAILPGSGEAVAINNVNHMTEDSCYIGNIPMGFPELGDVSCDGHPTVDSMAVTALDIEYDGFTKKLTAIAEVIPCSTYHIKLAIADVADGNLDSGVFLEANSFEAGASANVVSQGIIDSIVYETCDGGFLFTRANAGDTADPLEVIFNVLPASTATPGDDYAPLPGSVIIPAGETSVFLPVETVNDGVAEGPETILIELDELCNCDDPVIELIIDDPLITELFLEDVTICPGDSIVLDPAPSGGAPTAEFAWSTGETSPTITVSLGTGSMLYSVTVTDVCGVSVTDSAQVSTFEQIVSNLATTNVSCFGDNDGTAEVMPTGGTPPYTIDWMTNGNPPNALPAGVYAVTIFDQFQCSITDSFEIFQPDSLIVEGGIEILPCEGDSTGLIFVNVTGGTAPYNITWSNGVTGPSNGNLLPGTYAYDVVDANGCTVVGEVVLPGNEGPSLETMVLASSCFMGATGSAEVIISGGEPPYMISWDGGSTSEVVTNLTAGIYQVMVTDSNGCVAMASVEIPEDDPLECLISIDQGISVFGGMDGALTVAAPATATAPYNYNWSNGSTTASISGLEAGVYSATVTDADGCQSICMVELENPSKVGDFVWDDLDQNGIQDAGEPGLAGIMVNLTGVDLAGNSVDLVTVTDGLGAYSFDGLAGGSYQLSFSDLPLDYIFTSQNVGDISLDSDVNAAGVTGIFDLPQGVCDNNLDAGAYFNCDNITDPGIIAEDEYLCGPGNDPSLIFEVTPPAGGTGAIEFVWMKSEQGGAFNNGTWMPIPNSNTPFFDPGPIQVTTHYTRCVRRENCTVFQESNVVVKEVGNEALAIIEGPSTICVGDEVQFMAIDAGADAEISWSFGNNSTASSLSESIVEVSWDTYGVYTITLSVTNNGCVSTSSLQVFVTDAPVNCGGIAPSLGQDDQRNLLVNPNPTQDGVSIDWLSYDDQAVEVRLLGLSGQVIQSYSFYRNGAQYLDMSALPAGVYYLMVVDAKATEVLPIVKE